MKDAFKCPCCSRPAFQGTMLSPPILKMGHPGGQGRPWTWRSMTAPEVRFLIKLMRARLRALEHALRALERQEDPTPPEPQAPM